MMKNLNFLNIRKRSIDIVKTFGGTTVKNKFGRRICDKVRALKKTGLTFNDQGKLNNHTDRNIKMSII